MDLSGRNAIYYNEDRSLPGIVIRSMAAAAAAAASSPVDQINIDPDLNRIRSDRSFLNHVTTMPLTKEHTFKIFSAATNAVAAEQIRLLTSTAV